MTALASVSRHMISFGAIAALVVGGVVSASSVAPAVASSTQSSMSVYIDAPFVQGTYASSGTVLLENFDSIPLGTTCPTLALGSTSGTCRIETAGDFGGAAVGANVSTPTVAGSSSGQYASTSGTMTISFSGDQRYLGLWWSAGSVDNTLKFFKDNTLLLTVTTGTVASPGPIMTQFGTAPSWQNNDSWVALNTSSNVATSVGNIQHRRVWYYGNPRGYATNPPSAISSLRSNEPFLYLHMFAGGNLTFNKVELTGTNTSGFEFDNLAVSSTAQTLDPRLVLVQQITSSQYAVAFEPNGADVQGTMSTQVGTTSAALTTNAFTRPGFTFNGWATAADGSGTRYADAATYGFTADMTLYAQWTENSAGGSAPGTVNALAATGSNTAGVVGLAVSSALVGLALVSVAARYRRLNPTVRS